MKPRRNNSRWLSHWVIFVICFPMLLILPTFASSKETYKFERIWPTLQQPWYFNSPKGIAVDASGAVYVADALNNRIQKFSRDGHLITKWGNFGNGEREFWNNFA